MKKLFKQREKGLTLVEIVVSMGVMGMVITIFMQFQDMASKTLLRQEQMLYTNQITNLVGSLLATDKVCTQNFTNLGIDPNGDYETSTATFTKLFVRRVATGLKHSMIAEEQVFSGEGESAGSGVRIKKDSMKMYDFTPVGDVGTTATNGVATFAMDIETLGNATRSATYRKEYKISVVIDNTTQEITHCQFAEDDLLTEAKQEICEDIIQDIRGNTTAVPNCVADYLDGTGGEAFIPNYTELFTAIKADVCLELYPAANGGNGTCKNIHGNHANATFNTCPSGTFMTGVTANGRVRCTGQVTLRMENP
jgi:hypothetical protein